MTYTKPEVKTLGEASEVILGSKARMPVLEPITSFFVFKTLSYDLDD